jgi:nucleotide-binding universal stress UspA family protein
MQKIVVAYDGSDFSKNALKQAIALAKPLQASLLLLNIVEPLRLDLYPGMLGESFVAHDGRSVQEIEDHLITRLKEESAESLQEAEKLCEESGLSFSSEIRVGSARWGIMEFLDEQSPDLLVVGSRGLGAIKRLLLGTVSDYLIHHAPCSVLVVRSDD